LGFGFFVECFVEVLCFVDDSDEEEKLAEVSGCDTDGRPGSAPSVPYSRR
jgi:hypothetical protein